MNRMGPQTPRAKAVKSKTKASPAKSSQKAEIILDDVKSSDPSPKKVTTTPKSASTTSPRITPSEDSPADKSTTAATAIVKKGTPAEKREPVTPVGRKKEVSAHPGKKELTTPKSGRTDLMSQSSTQNNPSQKLTPTSVPNSGKMSSAKKAGLCFFT